MNNNILEYLRWRGDVPIDVSKFNEVDGIIIARVAYLPLELYFEEKSNDFATVGVVADALINSKNIKDTVLEKEDIELLYLLRNCSRFSEMLIGNYLKVSDNVRDIQFAACTVRLKKGSTVIAFRGTDSTLVGWKENFKLGIFYPLDSHKLAFDYFDKYSDRHGGKYILLGHSKGGNLAVYTAMEASDKKNKLIDKVINYDGPGFDDEILRSERYLAICNKINTFVPQNSLVGIIMGHKEPFCVVRTKKGSMVEQHDIYSWDVFCVNFIYEENRTARSIFVESTIREWLSQMTVPDLELLVESVVEVMNDLDCKTVNDFSKHLINNTKTLTQSLRRLDEKQRKIIGYGIGLFIKSVLTATKQLPDRDGTI